MEKYFPDTGLFIESVQSNIKYRGKRCFTAQELYRLRKCVLKVRQINEDDGEETT